MSQSVELSDEQFLRAVGVDKATFNVILERVAVHLESLRDEQPMKKQGRKSGLPLIDRLLLTFTYLRHYPTFARLGSEFGISESYANKIYHQILDVLVNVFSMKNRKHLLESNLQTIVRCHLERPTKGQRAYYSLKVQLIACLAMLELLSVICRKGSVHDYRILEESRLAISPETEKLAQWLSGHSQTVCQQFDAHQEMSEQAVDSGGEAIQPTVGNTQDCH